MTRIIQKSRVLAAVEHLALTLGRPVCSDDLRAFFREHPEARPDLLQRPGMVLAKCARKRGCLRIHQIGLIGNRSYYAPTPERVWTMRLECHRVRLRFRRELKLHFVDHALQLMRGRFEPLARNALAGWLLESSHFMRVLGNDPLAPLLDELRVEARRHAVRSYRMRCPAELIGRKAAERILRSQFEIRNPLADVGRLSLPRHLTLLRWPQSTLFPPRDPPAYWPRQIAAFVAYRWPLDDEDPIQARSLWIVLRYGPESS
jgi:hypothetical protein